MIIVAGNALITSELFKLKTHRLPNVPTVAYNLPFNQG